MINSKAALKRLPIGTRIKVLAINNPGKEKYVGQILTLLKVKTNSINWLMENGKVFYMDLEDTKVGASKNGFIRWNKNNEILSEYELVF